jgi:predicted adenine nucleotide alpha hydrolase (AANH) superfamily ATPase
MKKIIVHICCAICGCYLCEILKKEFEEIILFFENSNIYPKEEYQKRKESVIKLSEIYDFEFIEGGYNNEEWLKKIKGFEKEKEGEKRCSLFFSYRLSKTAELAKKKNFKFFTTTLSVSPFKNEKLIKEIGEKIAEKNNLEFIDFFDDKEFKKESWIKAKEISKKNNFYQQKYCGCLFSIR